MAGPTLAWEAWSGPRSLTTPVGECSMHLDRGGHSVSLSFVLFTATPPTMSLNDVSLFFVMESLGGDPKRERLKSAPLTGCPWRLIPGRGAVSAALA